MEQDFAQMIDDCRHGDRRAQRALYDATAPMAMGLCMRYCRDRDEAQDVMQDGYIKVFENLRQLKEPASLMPWVYRLMLNECINHCKRRRRTEAVENLGTEPWVFPDDPFSADEVVAALQQLSAQRRAVFNLVEVEGLEAEEVAQRLGLTLINVRTLLSRARKDVRRFLTR